MIAEGGGISGGAGKGTAGPRTQSLNSTLLAAAGKRVPALPLTKIGFSFALGGDARPGPVLIDKSVVAPIAVITR